jgi:hypothetical protein
MVSNWLSLPTLFAIQLGFSGVLGAQLYHLRSQFNSRQVAAAIAVGVPVMLSPLSMPALLQWLGWLAAILVVVLFALRPNHRFAPILTWRFAWRYAALVMALVALWSLFNGITSPLFILSGFAILAGGMAWHRSLFE